MTVGIADAVNKRKKIFSFTSLFLQNSQMWKIWQLQHETQRKMVWWREDGSFHLFRRLFNWQDKAKFPRIRCHNQILFLSCLINGLLRLKDLIRKPLFGCRFLCCVLKSNQAPITATTDLAKSTHVVWFTVMLVPSVAVQRCPRRNGVRLLKLTEAIPRKSPFCHGLFRKYFPVAVVLSSEAKYSKGGIIKIKTKCVLSCSCNTVTSFRFSCNVPLNCASASRKPELTRDTHVFPKPPLKRETTALKLLSRYNDKRLSSLKFFLTSLPEKTQHVSITLWDRKELKWKSSHRVFCAAAPIFFPLISSVCIQHSYPPSVRALNELSVILSCRFQSLISWAGIH